MSLESQNHEDDHDSDEKSLEDFAEMMRRWGVKSPQEPAEPLGIFDLTRDWCRSKFALPMAAVRALTQGHRQVEAAAALFAYCYTTLGPFYGETLEQCLEDSRERIEWARSDDARELRQSTKQRWLKEERRRAMICRDLIGFIRKYSSGQLLCASDRDDPILASYVDVLLTAARALVFSSCANKQYDPYVCEDLERAFEIIKQGKVQQAERFSTLKFNDEGRELSGDVEGFLACLGCAAVCYSLAWMKSELRPEHDRDYETAFKAYVYGAKHMSRTDYYIGHFFNNLFAAESEKVRGAFDVYWKIIEMWRHVRNSIESVRNRQELRSCLKDLEEIMWREGRDADSGDCTDDEPGFVYVPRQISFVDGRLSQQEITELIDQQKRGYQEKRLRIDFLDDLWWLLEVETRERLISAESEWYDGHDRFSYVESAVEHYSAALEIELRALLFSVDEVRRFVERIIFRQRRDKSYAKTIKLASRDTASINLKDISKLLKYTAQHGEDTEVIRKAISALPVAEKERALLSDGQFLEDMHDIYQLRIDSTHSLGNPHILLRTQDLRRRILGIGCRGYITTLAAMKGHVDNPGCST